MSKTYVAVQRSGQKQNELTHWKYIRKEKKNGKWRYYYDKESLKKDVDNTIGISAKNKLEEYDPERLAKAEKELKELNSLLRDKKISRSEYEKKIEDLSKSSDTSLKEAMKYIEIGDGVFSWMLKYGLNDDNNWKEGEAQLDELDSKASNTLNRSKNYEMAKNSYSNLANKTTKDIRKVETSIRAKEHRINQIKKSYETNKSIYDNSLLGRIDKGKQKVQSWMRKKLNIN